MEKRYQVFISSTFQDLQNARQEVSQALLRADCFPAGMELFPAADEEQFAFIKKVIDQSDYYIIISAGRYGSIHPETGLSYTEMEYDYAVETGKPVIRLLHEDPFNELIGKFIEPSTSGREKLRSFRKKMSSDRLVAFWSDEAELGLKVREGLDHAKKRFPAIGWVQTDMIPSLESMRSQSNELASENSFLREKIKENENDFKDTISKLNKTKSWGEHILNTSEKYDWIYPIAFWAALISLFFFILMWTAPSHVANIVINDDNIILRERPDEKSAFSGEVKTGDDCTVIDQNGRWSLLNCGGGENKLEGWTSEAVQVSKRNIGG